MKEETIIKLMMYFMGVFSGFCLGISFALNIIK